MKNGQSKIRNPKPKMVLATDGSMIPTLGPGPRFDFSPDEPMMAIAQLVYEHQGAERAITIERIARELWATEWDECRPNSHGNPTYPNRHRLQRGIKRYIADLVNLEGKLIVSNRGTRNPGYYMPENKKEIDAAERTYIRQAVAMINRAHRLTGNARYQELAGQLTLMSSVDGGEAGRR